MKVSLQFIINVAAIFIVVPVIFKSNLERRQERIDDVTFSWETWWTQTVLFCCVANSNSPKKRFCFTSIATETWKEAHFFSLPNTQWLSQNPTLSKYWELNENTGTSVLAPLVQASWKSEYRWAEKSWDFVEEASTKLRRQREITHLVRHYQVEESSERIAPLPKPRILEQAHKYSWCLVHSKNNSKTNNTQCSVSLFKSAGFCV